jgi:SAM-dependent methyltransferase
VTRNSLDHVTDPPAVTAEIARILRPGGTLLVSVDVDHPATPTEPHTLSLDRVRELLAEFEIESEDLRDEAHGGGGGRRVGIRARRREAA